MVKFKSHSNNLLQLSQEDEGKRAATNRVSVYWNEIANGGDFASIGRGPTNNQKY